MEETKIVGYCENCKREYIAINWNNPERACLECGLIGFGIPTDTKACPTCGYDPDKPAGAALAWARWVPVSERLPEADVDILFVYRGEVYYGKYIALETFATPYGSTLHDVSAWMHLPPPPETR